MSKYITFEEMVKYRCWKPELIKIYLIEAVRDKLRPEPRFNAIDVINVEKFLQKNSINYKKS